LKLHFSHEGKPYPISEEIGALILFAGCSSIICRQLDLARTTEKRWPENSDSRETPQGKTFQAID
jgi:hypothetical protein